MRVRTENATRKLLRAIQPRFHRESRRQVCYEPSRRRGEHETPRSPTTSIVQTAEAMSMRGAPNALAARLQTASSMGRAGAKWCSCQYLIRKLRSRRRPKHHCSSQACASCSAHAILHREEEMFNRATARRPRRLGPIFRTAPRVRRPLRAGVHGVVGPCGAWTVDSGCSAVPRANKTWK